MTSSKLQASCRRGSTHAHDLEALPAQHTEHAGCSRTSSRSLPRAVEAQSHPFEIISELATHPQPVTGPFSANEFEDDKAATLQYGH